MLHVHSSCLWSFSGVVCVCCGSSWSLNQNITPSIKIPFVWCQKGHSFLQGWQKWSVWVFLDHGLQLLQGRLTAVCDLSLLGGSAWEHLQVPQRLQKFPATLTQTAYLASESCMFWAHAGGGIVVHPWYPPAFLNLILML